MGDQPTGQKDDSREKKAQRRDDATAAKAGRDIREKTAEAKSPDAGVPAKRRDIRERADRPREPQLTELHEPRDVRDTPDKVGRAERVEARQATRHLDAREQREREKVFHAAEGVGFHHGVGDLSSSGSDHLRKTFDPLVAEHKEKVLAGKEKIVITATASRTGNEATNIRISKERADAVSEFLQDEYGIPKEAIETRALGEAPAAKEGHPDGRDNAQDRVAKIKIEPTGKVFQATDGDVHREASSETAGKHFISELPEATQTQHATEQGKILWDSLKKGLKETVKTGNYGKELAEAVREFAKNEGEWVIDKLVEDFDPAIRDKKTLIAANFVPGAIDGLAARTGQEVSRHENALFNPRDNLYALGRHFGETSFDRLSADEKAAITREIRGPRRSQFEKSIVEQILVRYLSHRVQY